MTTEHRGIPRRKPTQERAQETVNAIVLATAHILRTEGIERLTTNRIAVVAGVSIGSVYQYFPNKWAILTLLEDRYSDWIEGSVRGWAAEEPGPSLRDSVRPAIEAMIAMHRVDIPLHRSLSGAAHTVEASKKEVFRHMLRDFLVTEASRLRPLDPELVSRIAVRALEAVIHGTALDEPELLGAPAFAAETTELFVRYVEAAGP